MATNNAPSRHSRGCFLRPPPTHNTVSKRRIRPSQPRATFPFLRLPWELRRQVLGELIEPNDTSSLLANCHFPDILDSHRMGISYRGGTKFPIALLSVNRQIRKEFEELLSVVGVMQVAVTYLPWGAYIENRLTKQELLRKWWFAQRVKNWELYVVPAPEVLPTRRGYRSDDEVIYSLDQILGQNLAHLTHFSSTQRNCKLAIYYPGSHSWAQDILQHIKNALFPTPVSGPSNWTDVVILNDTSKHNPIGVTGILWEHLGVPSIMWERPPEILGRWDHKRKEMMLLGEAEHELFEKPFGFKRFYAGYIVPKDTEAVDYCPDCPEGHP